MSAAAEPQGRAARGPGRWLVVGAHGMLGRDMDALLTEQGIDHAAPGRADLDLSDSAAVKDAVAGCDIVVNAAAWTNVDGAETHEAEASAVNGEAVRGLARACSDSGARLLHPSTDYVFPGDATAPIPEDAPTSPLNAYGRSKLIGEQAVLELTPETGYVVRTAWLYGRHNKNFVDTMLRLAKERDSVNVVDDQRGQPTSTVALARQLLALGLAALAGDAPAGVYHGTCAGQTTWCGLAKAVYELTGLDPERVRPIGSDQYPLPAARPAYSVLGHGHWAAAGLAPMPHWREALAEYLGAGAAAPSAASTSGA